MKTPMTMSLLCSTGGFTRSTVPEGYRAIATYGPQLKVDGFEVLFYEPWTDYLDDVLAALRATGFRFPALHAEKSIGTALGTGAPADRHAALERLALNCAFAHSLGARVAVLHLWGLPESDTHYHHNLAALPDCLDVAAAHGVTLAIETILCAAADPLTRVREALERDARCRVTLDTEFLAHFGQLSAALEADWLWHGDIVRHVHIKDYDGRMTTEHGRRRFLQPGEGKIDFAAFFAGLRRRGYGGSLSLESSAFGPEFAVEIERTQRGLAALRALLATAR
ncbi:MAG TPA: sugar phosphate isomerase/epimerase [Ktedonobacterales bacterium]|nr:sugar phosphate isomerase/epimerase [Ktedonobacterales bacterium]